VIKNGVLLPSPFTTFSVDSTGERGLLGLAFDPDFSTNQWVYFYYTVSGSPRHNRVVRVTANGDVAQSSSEVLIFRLNDLSAATNHNGGAIHFGLDGKLYVGVGENATSSNSQSFSNLLGKMLRINKDGSIPLDNPFLLSTTGSNQAIWAMGLRNPFTFAIQSGTGRIFIDDVGQSTFEEINDGIGGSNYGWPTTEGPTNLPQFRSPLFSYGHGTGATVGCAIAGGTFYNPQIIQFPSSYLGKYFFADLCSGWIRLFNPATGTATEFATGINSPVDLKVGPDGSLYYLARGTGMVFRVTSNTTPVPDKVGTFRQGFLWLEDKDGNRQLTVPPDAVFPFGGIPGDLPITGDWNGDGRTKVGIYRSRNGTFMLDYDGDGLMTVADRVYNLGIGTQLDDIPVAGDWNGDGKTKVGLFRQGFLWILDTNGNGVFEQGADQVVALGGVPGDVPIVGDWDGDGRSNLGLFRQGFYWILDKNGNGTIDDINMAGGDEAFPFGGIAGDVPLIGDWNGDRRSEVGIFRQGFLWILDANGNHQLDGTGPGEDAVFPFGGIPGDKPVAGKW
jgi:glucose/arabinose dehydrogenase